MAKDHDTLSMKIPCFLPGTNRDWNEFVGIAKITTDGEVVVRFQDERASKGLVEMAKLNTLVSMSFDYRLTAAQIKEMNERYTKKIVSRVGSHPILLNGEDVGTAHINTDGTIEIFTEENRDEVSYIIDTTKKKDTV